MVTPGLRVLQLFWRTVWRQDADSEATRTYLRRVRGSRLQYPKAPRLLRAHSRRAPVAERLALPRVLIEQLQHTHEHTDNHHERCDFHGSPPPLGAGVGAVGILRVRCGSGVKSCGRSCGVAVKCE